MDLLIATFNLLMQYTFEWYKLILGFVGNHPFFCFFTFPIWAVLLFLPVFAWVSPGIIMEELFEGVSKKIKRRKS